MVHQVRLMIFCLNMMEYPMSLLLLSTWNFSSITLHCQGEMIDDLRQIQGTFCPCFWQTSRKLGPLENFFTFWTFGRTPPSSLKVGWGLEYFMILMSTPGPLRLIGVLKWVGLGWAWGLRVWGQALTIQQDHKWSVNKCSFRWPIVAKVS